VAPKLVVRADASAAIGTGHVMRGLAAALAWRDRGGAVEFVTGVGLPEALASRLDAAGFTRTVTDAPPGSEADARTVSDLAAGFVLIDGYTFSGEYEARVRGAGHRVAAVDDDGHTAHQADVVLNQNLHADAASYAPIPPSRLLLGPRFALLRPEFADPPPRPPQSGRRVLVTMGGADPAAMTGRVLRALAPLGLEVRAVIGGADPRRRDHVDLAQSLGMNPREDVRDMAAEMAWADLAVATPSVTHIELLAMGVPAVLIAVAENQRPGQDAAARAGLALSVGWHENVDEALIAEAVDALARDPARARAIATRGRALVDGRGASRLVDALRGQPS
jgi:UDP-2,4-diacetamido-2,4,6-trideoxy-beta-L-altropyranose hydrolase